MIPDNFACTTQRDLTAHLVGLDVPRFVPMGDPAGGIVCTTLPAGDAWPDIWEWRFAPSGTWYEFDGGPEAMLGWADILGANPNFAYGEIEIRATRNAESDTPAQIVLSKPVTVYNLVWDAPPNEAQLEIGTEVDWTVHVTPALDPVTTAIDWRFETIDGETYPMEGEGVTGSNWQSRVWTSTLLSDNASVEVYARALVRRISDDGWNNLQPGEPATGGVGGTEEVDSETPPIRVRVSHGGRVEYAMSDEVTDGEVWRIALPLVRDGNGDPYPLTLVASEGPTAFLAHFLTWDLPGGWSEISIEPLQDQLNIQPSGPGTVTATTEAWLEGPGKSVEQVQLEVMLYECRVNAVNFQGVLAELADHMNGSAVSSGSISEYVRQPDQDTPDPANQGANDDPDRNCFALFAHGVQPSMRIHIEEDIDLPDGWGVTLRGSVQMGGSGSAYTVQSDTLTGGSNDILMTPISGGDFLPTVTTDFVADDDGSNDRGSSHGEFTVQWEACFHPNPLPAGESLDDYGWNPAGPTTSHNVLVARAPGPPIAAPSPPPGESALYQIVAWNSCHFAGSSSGSTDLDIASNLVNSLESMRVTDDLVIQEPISAIGDDGMLYYGNRNNNTRLSISGLLTGETVPDLQGTMHHERAGMCGTWARLFEEMTTIHAIECPAYAFILEDSSPGIQFTWYGFTVPHFGVNRPVFPSTILENPGLGDGLITFPRLITFPFPSLTEVVGALETQETQIAHYFGDHAINLLDYNNDVFIFDPSFSGGPYPNAVNSIPSSGSSLSGNDAMDFVENYFSHAANRLTGVVYFVVGHGELSVGIDANQTAISASDLEILYGGISEDDEPKAVFGLNDGEIVVIAEENGDYTLTRGRDETLPRPWPSGTPVRFLQAETGIHFAYSIDDIDPSSSLEFSWSR